MKLLLSLVCRNIMRNRRRTLFTVSSLAIGGILLSLTLSLTEGSYSTAIDLFTRDHTGHAQIHVKGYLDKPNMRSVINHSDEIYNQLKTDSEVINITPRLYAPVLSYGAKKSFPAQLIGIQPSTEKSASYIDERIQSGRYFRNDTERGAVIGFTLAQNLQLKVGDSIVLIGEGYDGSIANDIYPVIGITGTKDSSERLNIYLSIPSARDFLSLPNGVHELSVLLSHYKDAQSFTSKWTSKLPSSLEITPWQVIEKTFFNSMTADKEGGKFSVSVIIFIVAIGVLNSILMSTMERTYEFGLLKAIGTRPRQIFLLIITETALVAMIAAMVMIVICIPMNIWLANVGIKLPTPLDVGGVPLTHMLGEISAYTLLYPTVIILSSALLVGLYPAWRSARLSPVSAMGERR